MSYQRCDELMQSDYPASDLNFSSSDSFAHKLDMSDNQASDVDYYSFHRMSHSADTSMNAFSTYETPISPALSGSDLFFGANMNRRPMHVDPAATWKAEESLHMSANIDPAVTQSGPDITKLTDYEGPARQFFGQITPPSEADGNASKSVGQRADFGIDQHSTSREPSHEKPSNARTTSNGGRSSKRARRESQISEIDDEAPDGVDGGKREKYREKNRVAAAKCRAKKKTHVDNLEDTHRTQSVLNTALKQTEKSLRDELSFWRTQALQHTFCSCRSIQDYNMRKAQNLAAGTMLSNSVSKRSQSVKSVNSASAMSPSMDPCGVHPTRSHSTVGFEFDGTSPIMSTMGMDVKINSTVYPEMDTFSNQQSSEPLARRLAMSSNTEQGLEKFVGDIAEQSGT